MQNDFSEKRLAKLGVANEEEDVRFLRVEVKRLVELLEDKEKELQIVKKHFEELFANTLNSRIAVNPAPVMPGFITVPGGIGDVYIGDGTGDSGTYPGGEVTGINITGNSIDHMNTGITNGSTIVDISSIDDSILAGYSNENCNISNNIFDNNDWCSVFKMNSEDSEALSLTGT